MQRFRRSAYNRRRAPGRATRGINVRALAGRADGAAWSASDADSESASDSDACDSDDSSDESFDARRERVYSDDEECVRYAHTHTHTQLTHACLMRGVEGV